jgi:predicted RNase H-like HicB family nuclease
MYRAGLPGWKFLAKLGVPVLVRVQVMYDDEVKSYWATSPDLDGLAVSGSTLDELKAEAMAACQELLELALAKQNVHATARLTYEPALCAA